MSLLAPAASQDHYHIAFHNLLKVKLKVTTALPLPAYLLDGMKVFFLILQMSFLFQNSLRHSWQFLKKVFLLPTLIETKVTGLKPSPPHSLPLPLFHHVGLTTTQAGCKLAWTK